MWIYVSFYFPCANNVPHFNFRFRTLWTSLIIKFVFLSHLFPKTHPFSTYKPKISIPPPVFSEKLEKDGRCRKMFKYLISKFFRLLTSRYSEFRPLFTQNVSNISNNALTFFCHIDARVLRPYNRFFSFLYKSKMPRNPHKLNGIHGCQ